MQSNQIEQIIKDNYGISIAAIKLLRDLPSRQTYLLTSDDRAKFILKIYDSRTMREDVLTSIEIQKKLLCEKFNIPAMKKTNGGKFYIEINSKILICWEYIKGQILSLSSDNIRKAAKLLKKLHQLGILHNDFLLENIIESSEGQLFLIDWDFADYGNTQEDVKWIIKREIKENKELSDKEKENFEAEFLQVYQGPNSGN